MCCHSYGGIFDHVVRLLPEDSVTNIERFRNTRTLHDVDWERALFHTKHTTEIGVTVHDDLLMNFGSNLPSKHVFPVLRRTLIGVQGGTEVPSVALMKVFLPSHVSSIEIVIHRGSETHAKAVLNFIANDISLSELTRFSVTDFDFRCGPAISQAILSHRSIQSLTIVLWSATQAAPILQSAAQLPHLHHISISDFAWGATYLNIRLLPRGSLAAVTTLKMVGGLSFVHAMLGLPVAGNMESMCFRLPTGGGDEITFAECLQSIGQFTRLKCLELRLEMPVPWSAVSMLAGCRELEVFRVIVALYGSLDISETGLERMADALPSLQELSLKPLDKHVWGIPHLPIHHLHHIATRFRTLRKLCVSVDATAEGNPTFDWTAPEALANEVLEELDVSLSMVDPEAKVIATMFRAWWPRLRLVKSESDGFGPVWAEVNAIICGESK